MSLRHDDGYPAPKGDFTPEEEAYYERLANKLGENMNVTLRNIAAKVVADAQESQ